MTVLGSDDRSAVTDTSAYPYSAIVQVWVDYDGDGTYDGWGTGAVIGSNDILTAGHVLWDSYYGYAKNIKVVLADQTTTVIGVSWQVPDAYVSSGGSASYDIGVVNLESAIADLIGTFAVGSTTAADLVGTTVTTAGYPGDLSSDGSVMVTASGTVDGTIGSSRIYYDGTLDTYGGQSGSPLWVTVNGEAVIVGVHTTGGTTYNAGTVVTSTLNDLIEEWTGDELDPSVASVTAVSGTSGADAMTGSAADDELRGLDGDDGISGGAGADLIYGNRGADLLSGGDGADTMLGGQNQGPASTDGAYRSGIETLYGGNGGDQIYGNVGSDQLYGEDGADILYGGQDGDVLYGGGDADRLFGNLGDDTLLGGDGGDTLVGGSGDDLLYGDGALSSTGAGTDTIDGGDGVDTAVYLNARSNYSFAVLADGAVQVNGADLLYNVEYLRFSDTTVTVDSLI